MMDNRRNPKTPPILPPEILDMVLEHIPAADREGRRILIACTLVATWWVAPSQRRLFSSVDIHQRNYERWMNGVVLPGSKPHLLEYVRSLSHCCSSVGAEYQMRELPRDSGGYLSALCNIHTLRLFNFRIELIDQDGFRTCFSAFRETLTCLSLSFFITPFDAFVTLVDYFPNITTLQLHSFTQEPAHDGLATSLSRPLRGEVHISGTRSSYLVFLDRFTKLDLEYERLIIGSPYPFMETEFLERALRISANTVKFLKLTVELPSAAEPTISDFWRLRELELVVPVAWPSPTTHAFLLGSITSTELRKIIFLVGHMGRWWNFPREVKKWASIDEHMCGLVDRLRAMEYHHTLEAELRFRPQGGDDIVMYDFSRFFPKFREKGIVTVVDIVHGDRIFHSSVHDC